MPSPSTSLPQSRTLREEATHLLRLAAPIALVQLGMTAMGFVDVAFLGRYDAAALAAMSLGNTLSWGVIFFCLGVLAAVDPLLSQAVGAGDRDAIPRTLLRGFALAIGLAVPATLLLMPAATWFEWLGQPTDQIADAAAYARINTLGIAPILWFQLLRALHSAHSRTGPQLIAIAIGNACNAVLDWLFIDGNLGCPALGVHGAAWATVVSRWLLFFLLAWTSRDELRAMASLLRERTRRREVLGREPLVRLFRLGLPIGGQFALETGVFAATAMLVGRLDALAMDKEGLRLCGHQVALQMATLSFMLPLGLGLAASVRVGWATGRGDPAAARRTAKATLAFAVLVMSMFMGLYLLAPDLVARILTDDERVIAWAVLLLPIAGVFQIGDGLQVTAIGLLRGAGDVHSPFWINVVGFWVVGLPLGCWLAFPWGMGLGPEGLWWGLVAGLFAVAAALLLVVKWRFAELRPRLSVD